MYIDHLICTKSDYNPNQPVKFERLNSSNFVVLNLKNMKNLRLLQIFVLALFMMSCDKDDSNDNNAPISGDPGITATINGGTYSNYAFSDAIYQTTLGSNNTMDILAGDIDGDQITLFLNSTGGFGAGTIKTMGDMDSNNFTNHVLIRQLSSTQLQYFSTSGNVTITENRAHPTEAGTRLISGTFTVTAATQGAANTTSMTGSFIELEYQD